MHSTAYRVSDNVAVPPVGRIIGNPVQFRNSPATVTATCQAQCHPGDRGRRLSGLEAEVRKPAVTLSNLAATGAGW